MDGKDTWKKFEIKFKKEDRTSERMKILNIDLDAFKFDNEAGRERANARSPN